jgi:hypothetical protein
VFRALTELPEPWIVISDIPFGIFGRPRPGLAQIDFLLVHAQRGLVVIEVKGGRISTRHGQFFTRPHGATEDKPLRRSPFDQAADQRFELQRFLYKHLPIKDEAMAHAVAFPDSVIEGSLVANVPAALVLDMNALSDPGRAIDGVLRSWRPRLSLEPPQVERLVRLLKPSMEMQVVLAARVALTERGIARETRRQVEFSESQVAAYRTMLQRERTLVVGEAGTGKTVLAVERARRLAATGSRTLLLCHRAVIAAAMATLLEMSPSDRRANSRDDGNMLVLRHWTGLRQDLEAFGDLPSNNDSADFADAMLAAADAGQMSFDAIVLDEGQEFTPGQLEGLTWLLTDPEDGPFYVFADPFQHSGLFTASRREERDEVRGSYDWRLPFEAPVVVLVDNCRNAQPIAEIAGAFVRDRKSRSRVDGSAPEFSIVRGRRDLLNMACERVAGLLESLRAAQLLVVLTGFDEAEFVDAARRHRFDTVSTTELSRFPLTPIDLRVAYGLPDHVQGLEAEVVVALCWQDGPMNVARVRDLYVAFSRARSHLAVFSNRDSNELRLAAHVALQQDPPDRD